MTSHADYCPYAPTPPLRCNRAATGHSKGRPVGSALAPVAAGTSSHKVCRSGVCGCTDLLSGAWQERNRDHVWEKRCSRLDLLGCDLGSGYAAQDLRTRETKLAYCSLRLRADARAAPASSLELACPIAPPLCAPARVIPGRTLVEGEGRVGYRASPQLQSTPLFSCRWLLAVPIPVLLGPHSEQGFAGFPIAIAIEIGVPLAQQLLRFGIGADLLAAVPTTAWSGAIGDGC